MLPALFVLSLALNLPGAWWGQPGGIDWDFDSIAGLRTVKQMPHLFGEWRDKYPRLQFLINAAAYRPLLDRAFAPKEFVPGSEARIMSRAEWGEHFGALIVASRLIAALMGALAVLGVALAAQTLFRDALAGFFAGLTLALSYLFVLYAHLGNVDGPATFWYAWSLCAAAWCVRGGGIAAPAFLGLTAAAAVGTKEPLGGYLLGLGLAVVIGMAPAGESSGWSSRWGRSLLALVVFAAALAAIDDLVAAPGAFADRMGHWLGGPGVDVFYESYRGPIPLLVEALREIYLSVGWPLAALALASTIHVVLRAPLAAAFALLPIVSFYTVVIINVQGRGHRYFLPLVASLALLCGKGAADLLRAERLPPALRAAALVTIFGLSFLYCVGSDLEMIHDSRYAAESWFAANVPAGTRVVALCPPTLAPRLQQTGQRYECRWGQPTRQDVVLQDGDPPEYLVTSEKYVRTPGLFDPALRRALADGSLGYRSVAVFGPRYLWPARSPFGVAGWPMERLDQVSPEIEVFRRQQSAAPAEGTDR